MYTKEDNWAKTSSHVQSDSVCLYFCGTVLDFHLMLVYTLNSGIHILFWGMLSHGKGKIILHKQRHHFQVDHTLSQFLNLLNRPSSDLTLQVPIAPKSFSEPNGLSLCLPILPIQQAKVPKNHLQKKVFFHGEATEDSFLHLGSLHLHAIVLACTLLGRLKWSTHARINRSLTL